MRISDMARPAELHDVSPGHLAEQSQALPRPAPRIGPALCPRQDRHVRYAR